MNAIERKIFEHAKQAEIFRDKIINASKYTTKARLKVWRECYEWNHSENKKLRNYFLNSLIPTVKACGENFETTSRKELKERYKEAAEIFGLEFNEIMLIAMNIVNGTYKNKY